MSLLKDLNLQREASFARGKLGGASRLSAIALLLGTVSACGAARIEVLETEVSRQREEMSELRRNQAAQRVQFDEFRNRLLVLQDKLESERLVAQRSAAIAADPMPTLPRVVLPAPETSAPPAQAPAAPRSVVIGPDGVPHVDGQPQGDDVPAEPAAKARRSKPAGPSQGTTAPPQDGNTPEEAAAASYHAAKAQLDAGNLAQARKMFEAFLAAYPDHTLADNALYWIGETWYAKALWIKSARVFSAVVKRFPNGNKVPDAMLKTGLCYVHLGEHQAATEVFNHLLRQYPSSPAAEIGREQRARLEAKR